jgi:hypothetical protein
LLCAIFPLDKCFQEDIRWGGNETSSSGTCDSFGRNRTRVRNGHAVPAAPAFAKYASTAGTRVLTLTISATVDGCERFIFTRDSVYDEHGRWQAPKNVVFNGEPWPDLSSPPPGWEKLAVNLDLTKAAVVQRKGRDVIALERTTEGFDLYFADTQMGAASTIAIPLKWLGTGEGRMHL